MRACSICLEPGHRRETCTSRREAGTGRFRASSGPEYNKAIDEDTVREIIRMKVDENMPVRTIAETIGIAHATVLRYLSKNGISHRTIVKRTTPAITEDQYWTVRVHRMKAELNSFQVAELVKIPLEEVNAVWSSASYDYYLRHR